MVQSRFKEKAISGLFPINCNYLKSAYIFIYTPDTRMNPQRADNKKLVAETILLSLSIGWYAPQ